MIQTWLMQALCLRNYRLYSWLNDNFSLAGSDGSSCFSHLSLSSSFYPLCPQSTWCIPAAAQQLLKHYFNVKRLLSLESRLVTFLIVL